MSWSTEFDFGQWNSGNQQPTNTGSQRPSAEKNRRQSTSHPGTVISDIKGSIAALYPGVPGNKLIGLIIAKDDPRSFPSKKEPGMERHLLNFTIRDSPVDFINVTCWGSEPYIGNLASHFHIGDSVEMSQYVVQTKPTDGSDEKFRPSTTSPYQLSIGENRSTISLYVGTDMAFYSQLSHIAVKSSNDFFTINDIMTNGKDLHGENISIMAVVRSDESWWPFAQYVSSETLQVGPVRNLKTKFGKQLKHCSVILMDETSTSFQLNLWSEEFIAMAQGWTPKDNVLFGADLRVTFDEYKKTMVAAANSKSIITVNPDTREAHSLYKYAQTLELEDKPPNAFSGGRGDSKVEWGTKESIQTVYTVQQLKERLHTVTADGGVDYGILYCYVSHFNIDGNAPVSSVHCARCYHRVDRDMAVCTNVDCPQGSQALRGDYLTAQDVVVQFNLSISLTDQTGTVSSCHLEPEAVRAMLQCTVEEFDSFTEAKKTQLKWDYLLEKCKVYVKMNLPTYERRKPIVRVLSCTRADLLEAVKFL